MVWNSTTCSSVPPLLGSMLPLDLAGGSLGAFKKPLLVGSLSPLTGFHQRSIIAWILTGWLHRTPDKEDVLGMTAERPNNGGVQEKPVLSPSVLQKSRAFEWMKMKEWSPKDAISRLEEGE